MRTPPRTPQRLTTSTMRGALRTAAFVLASGPVAAWASGGEGGFAATLLGLAVILVGAKVGGDLAQRLKQPAVLGELLAGLALSNLRHLGFDPFGFIGTDSTLAALAELGVILLLFEVGLETTVSQMRRVGSSALLVAVLGVVTPMVLGYGVSAWLQPQASPYVHLFLGATLSATSVGITARVLKDLGQSHSGEARVILGAAVIDDVLGLVVLATVTALIGAANRGEDAALAPVLAIVAKTGLFLGGTIGLGAWISPRVYGLAARLRSDGVLLAVSLAFCFALSWLAARVGLAPIVGAFAAGLVIEGGHHRPFAERGEPALPQLIAPVASFLSPVFFVLMGFRVDLRSFADPAALGLALALTVAAVLGKQACAWGVLDKGIRRLPVGLGMIPRGEVGLIFANIGLGLRIGGAPLLSGALYSAIVMMVIATTLLTPPLLSLSLGRTGPADDAPPGPPRGVH